MAAPGRGRDPRAPQRLSGAVARLRDWLDRRGRERELDEELAFHVEQETAAGVARGLPAGEARRRALALLGGVEPVKERCREARSGRWLEDLAGDLRYGARSLARSPGYAATVVVTLALAVGANSAIFSVVHGVLLKPLPYASGESLVRIVPRAAAIGEEEVGFSVEELADYRARMGSLDALVEAHTMYFTLLSHGEPDRVRTGVVSPEYFDVLGLSPVLGRSFAAADDLPGAPPVLLLAHPYWQRRFGGDPAIVGQAVELNDRAHTVIGVLPPVPLVPEEADVFMPTAACPFRSAPDFVADRDARMMTAYGRLHRRATPVAAAGEAAAVAAALAAEHPGSYPPGSGYTATAVPVAEELTRAARPTFLVLLAAVGLVLLIACANVAHLALARRLARRQELAVRAALGASRERLARQLLTEAVLLALAAGALGLGLAAASLDLLTAFAARYSPRAVEIALDPAVVAFTLAVALGAGLAFGALPAFARDQPAASLAAAGGGRVAAAGGLRRALVVGQLAVSLVLLAAAGLAGRSLWALSAVDAGFEAERVLSAGIPLNWTKYDDPEEARAFYLALLDRVRGPEVAAAAVAGTYPLAGQGLARETCRFEGEPPPAPGLAPQVDVLRVSEEYFEVLGMPVVAGRGFTAGDDAAAPAVAVVGRALARRWEARAGAAGRGTGEAVLGRRISLDDGESWATVVGVAGDVRHRALDREADEAVYLSYRQGPGWAGGLLVRAAGDPRPLAGRVRAAVTAIDPEQPLADVATLAEVRAAALAPPRLTAALLAAFALLALAIAAAGVAGLMAYAVGQRSHEIGVRLALGAGRARLLGSIVGQGLALAAAGAGLGVVAALALTRPLAGLLFQVEPGDPTTLAAVTATLLAVAGAACLAPARRATAIDPVRALRSE